MSWSPGSRPPSSPQRLLGGSDCSVEAPGLTAQQDAELVPADPVGGAVRS